jgi:hypothetical protein
VVWLLKIGDYIKKIKLNRFYFTNKRKHKTYVFDKVDNKFKSVVFSHSKKSDRDLKINNPSPKDSGYSYLQYRRYYDDEDSFGKEYPEYKIKYCDKRKVKRFLKKK